MKAKIGILVASVLVAIWFFTLESRGVAIHMLSEGRSLSGFLGTVAVILAIYELCVLAVAAAVHLHKGAPSEVKMLSALLRAAAAIVIFIEFMHYLGRLTGSWAAVAGFAGLLMGWSLQAPVSGLAAWVFVNLKRPFRVGDRVMLPAWGLTGDVTQIGMMYTVLNQVGGTVGSEEAAGRYVLIPNAMLFGNIVINYTPMQAAAYVLDEVIVRITHSSNWDLAERICIDAAREVTGDMIKETEQEPYIRADMYDYGVYLRLRYMTAAMDRPRIVYEITKRIFRDFQEHPDIDWAIPYVFSHRTGRRAGARHLEPARDVNNITVEVDVYQVHDSSGFADKPDYAEHIRELAKRIAEEGLLQPIIVEKREDGQYTVVAGHLRLAACKMLGWETIPAIVRSTPDAGGP